MSLRARTIALVGLLITIVAPGRAADSTTTPTVAADSARPAVPSALGARASSERVGHAVAAAADGVTNTFWASAARDRFPWLELDLGVRRAFDGLVIDWATGLHARDYILETSLDHAKWTSVRTVRNARGGRDTVNLPDTEARWVRLLVRRAAMLEHVGVREISVPGMP